MLTYENALKIYESGKDAVITFLIELSKQIESLQQKIILHEHQLKALQDQLAKNSQNSSKPPSSDGLNKPKLFPSRPKTNRKTGGQKGHQGHTLKMVENPDEVIYHAVEKCQCCGEPLIQEPIVDIDRRQIFDIPPIKIVVTEHQIESKKCPHCGRISKAEIPIEISAPVQYGNNTKAIAVYLMNQQLIPLERTCEFFNDIFSHNISEGTLVKINNECSNQLKPYEKTVQQKLIESNVVNFDETGCQVKSKRKWLHVASTKELTSYYVHEKRGSEAMEANGILPEFKGTAVHDFWKPYLKFDCNHSLCNAHLLRDLKFIEEQDKQAWATEMKTCLLDIKKAVDEAKERGFKALYDEKIQEFEKRYDEIITQGVAENPEDNDIKTSKRGRRKKSKAQNLIERLKEHRKKVLAFMYDFRVPFDNNQGERDIRMTKVKQKISGTFRSQQGAKNFCRIRGFISTVKKHTKNIFNSICNVFENKPLILSDSSV